jgi:Zn-dependent protease
VFNCIPIPPFDGSRIVFALLPSKWYFAIMKYERIIMVIMLLALYAGLLSGPLNSMTNFLVNGMYDIVYTVCDWVQRLWNLVF